MKKINVVTQICKYELFSAMLSFVSNVDSKELSIDDAKMLESCAKDIRIKLEDQASLC